MSKMVGVGRLSQCDGSGALFPKKDIERVIYAYPGGFLVPRPLVCRDQVQMFEGVLFPSKGSKQTRWAGI